MDFLNTAQNTDDILAAASEHNLIVFRNRYSTQQKKVRFTFKLLLVHSGSKLPRIAGSCFYFSFFITHFNY